MTWTFQTDTGEGPNQEWGRVPRIQLRPHERTNPTHQPTKRLDKTHKNGIRAPKM